MLKGQKGCELTNKVVAETKDNVKKKLNISTKPR